MDELLLFDAINMTDLKSANLTATSILFEKKEAFTADKLELGVSTGYIDFTGDWESDL